MSTPDEPRTWTIPYELAEMLRALTTKIAAGGPLTVEDYSINSAVWWAMPQPEPVEPLMEAYCDVLCALQGHEHTGRPRCTSWEAAERLLALHEAQAPHAPPVAQEDQPVKQAPIMASLDLCRTRWDGHVCRLDRGHEGPHFDQNARGFTKGARLEFPPLSD